MMQVFTYCGDEPSVHLAEERKLMLEVMLKQLDVLKMMAQTVVMIREGTRISPVSTPEPKPCYSCRKPLDYGVVRDTFGYRHHDCPEREVPQ